MGAEATRKVLVTGGAGFIGSHVAEGYLARGDRVWIVDDLSRGRREHLPHGAEFHEMDIADPRIRTLFRQVGFDLVNHHAAKIDVRRSVDDPLHDARVNTLGLLNLAEASIETGVERFVYASSGGVLYGESAEIPTGEGAPKSPLSPYGISKLSGEFYLHYYGKVHGMRHLSLRYSNVYGPRQDPRGEAGVVAIFLDRLREGAPLTIFGDGEQTRDYIYVRDIVSANLILSDMPAAPEVGGTIDDVAFNVGSGSATTVNRLADLLEGAAGARPGREYRGPRAGELRHSTLDADKLRAWGWQPRHSLKDGLRETLRSLSAAGVR